MQHHLHCPQRLTIQSELFLLRLHTLRHNQFDPPGRWWSPLIYIQWLIDIWCQHCTCWSLVPDHNVVRLCYLGYRLCYSVPLYLEEIDHYYQLHHFCHLYHLCYCTDLYPVLLSYLRTQ